MVPLLVPKLYKPAGQEVHVYLKRENLDMYNQYNVDLYKSEIQTAFPMI